MLRSLFINWFQTHDLLNREGPFTFCIDYIIWYIVVGLLIAVGIFFLNKYKTKKRIKIVLTVLWAVAVAIDLAKLIKNIYYGFNINGDIPFYICSLYLYTMPVVIWGKGLWQRMACTYNCTIGLFGAISKCHSQQLFVFIRRVSYNSLPHNFNSNSACYALHWIFQT